MPTPIFNKRPPINLSQAIELKEALEKMLPIPLGIEDTPAIKKFGRWQNAMELSKEALETTEQEDIKDAYYVLNDWQETLTEAPKYEVESNTLTPEQLQELGLKSDERLKQKAESKEWSSATVKAGIAKQQEIYEEKIKQAKAVQTEFEKKEKYAKIETTELTGEQKAQYEVLERKARSEPKEAVNNLKAQILQNTNTPEPVATFVAGYTVLNIQNNNQEVVKAKILNSLDKKDFPWTEELSNQNLTQAELAHLVLEASLGKNFADKAVPIEKVEVSETAQSGFTTVNLAFAPKEAVKIIEENQKGFENKALNETDWANQKTGSILSRLQSDGQLVTETATFTSFQPNPNFDWNTSSGPNLVNTMAKGLVRKGVSKAAGAVAAKTGLKAAITSLSVPTGPVGVVLTWLGTEIVGKLLDKINWKKVREYSFALMSLPVIGVGLIFGIPGLALGGGIMGGIGLGMGAGMTIGGMIAGIGGVLGAIGTATLGAIGVPILVTLLVFPVIVAFILFIINSGAYIVPYGSLESGPGGITPADCQGLAPPKPEVSGVRFSSDGKYAYPVAPFPSNPYSANSCYHWDGNKAIDAFAPQSRTPMVAFESGTITNVTLNDSEGGKYIILKGNSGRYYYYAHLCHLFVDTNANKTVKAGDVIATMDTTGNGRVEHLHFAINDSKKPLLGDTIDEFVGGDGNICPFTDFEEKFNLGICNSNTACVKP